MDVKGISAPFASRRESCALSHRCACGCMPDDVLYHTLNCDGYLAPFSVTHSNHFAFCPFPIFATVRCLAAIYSRFVATVSTAGRGQPKPAGGASRLSTRWGQPGQVAPKQAQGRVP